MYLNCGYDVGDLMISDVIYFNTSMQEYFNY